MRQLIEKSVFDWSRGENKKVMAKGVVAMAILSHRVDVYGNVISKGSTRCVWDNNLQHKTDNRFLKRRVWIS